MPIDRMGVRDTPVWPHRDTHICMQLCRYDGADVESRGICLRVPVCVYNLTKVWDHRKGDWNMHTGSHRCTYVFTQLCKGVELMWAVRLASIHVLMHVHILAKACDQMKGYWDIHNRLYRCAHVCTHL